MKNPIREVLHAMTGRWPPAFVKGYGYKGLTEEQVKQLQDWCASNVKPSWLTGIGLMDAAQNQVQEAVNNGNIPPDSACSIPETCGVCPPPKKTAAGELLVIPKTEWLQKRRRTREENLCPCDAHPPEKCETCRGACSCHFKQPGAKPTAGKTGTSSPRAPRKST